MINHFFLKTKLKWDCIKYDGKNPNLEIKNPNMPNLLKGDHLLEISSNPLLLKISTRILGF